MLPAQQRLDRHDRVVVQRDDRLIGDPQLAALQRPAQIVLQRETRDGAQAHRTIEHLEAPASAALGLIHGGVGVAHEIGRQTVGIAGKHDPEARLGEMLARAERERQLEGPNHAFCDVRSRGLVGNLLEQHDELIAAKARDRVTRAQGALQPRRDPHQQLVAGAMAEAVVDELEVVDVQEHDGDLGVRPRQRVPEAVHEQHAVGQTGQGIVQRLVADVVFAGSLLQGVGKDVGERPDEVRVRGGEAQLACGGE